MTLRAANLLTTLFVAGCAMLATACGGGGGGGGAGGSGNGGAGTGSAPGAPINVSATAGNGNAVVAFAPSAAGGAGTATSFAATCAAGGASQTVTGAASPLTVSPLINNTTYSCSVTASNAFGVSPASTAATVTPLGTIGAPGAPTLLTATAANTSTLLSFQAPAGAGASPITAYTAACRNGSTTISQSGASSPILVLGLTNAVGYSCTVTAANATGAGPASLALSVTPNPTPATPAGVAEFTTVDFTVTPVYTNPTLPAYYDNTVDALDNAPANPAATDRIATLGRVLFSDKRISINDTIACASCHQQAKGFTDPNRFSTGFSGAAFTTAHSMRIGNARYYRPGSAFWDKRSASLEDQASQPMQNAVEMGWTAAAGGIAALITKLNATTYYRDLFNWAFGNPTITEARMQTALAQFERAMISSSSRWDDGYAQTFSATAPNRGLGTPLPNFTAEENRGRDLFMNPRGQGGAGCAGCHIPPTFSLAANSLSNGLDAGETRIFKSPSLKNIGLTGPFMHDGRFSTIEQVVDFYDHGIQAGPALDNRLRQGAGGPPIVLNLSAADKAALAAFLRTLDDPVLTTDRRFGGAMVK